MADILFITPAEVAATTILGGNVDPDRYTINIAFTQTQVIEPLLGTELYDAMITKFATASYVASDMVVPYKTIMIDYVQPITKHEGLAEYLEVSNLMVEQGGTFIHTAEYRQVATKEDLQSLSLKYHTMAQMYIKRFEKWICKNIGDVSEYKRYQDEVNAQEVKVTPGLYFGQWQRSGIGNLDARDYIDRDIQNE